MKSNIRQSLNKPWDKYIPRYPREWLTAAGRRATTSWIGGRGGGGRVDLPALMQRDTEANTTIPDIPCCCGGLPWMCSGGKEGPTPR